MAEDWEQSMQSVPSDILAIDHVFLRSNDAHTLPITTWNTIMRLILNWLGFIANGIRRIASISGLEGHLPFGIGPSCEDLLEIRKLQNQLKGDVYG